MKLNDRHQILSILSKCPVCKYYDAVEISCDAFHEGIPDKYLTGEAIHDKKEPGQKGEFVFTPG